MSSMHEYRIKVLSSGHPILVVDATHISDHDAVRSAKDLADDNLFEVWRGLDCIYAPPKAHLAPVATSVVATAGAWMKRVLQVGR